MAGQFARANIKCPHALMPGPASHTAADHYNFYHIDHYFHKKCLSYGISLRGISASLTNPLRLWSLVLASVLTCTTDVRTVVSTLLYTRNFIRTFAFYVVSTVSQPQGGAEHWRFT